MTSPDSSESSIARNIVNQLGDLWEVPVDKRQATNDQADQFVESLVRKAAEPLQLRVEAALEQAVDGQYDGEHHKYWVLDQIVRILTGCPEEPVSAVDVNGVAYTYNRRGECADYLAWRQALQGSDGVFGSYDAWSEGVAP